MNRVFLFSAACALSLPVAACGGDDESGSGGSAAATTATTTSASGGGGGMGQGGAGGDGQGGDGQGGEGGAPNPNLINGCDPETATEMTGADADVVFDAFAYDPPCLRLTLGKHVNITGDFMTYPIQGGTVVDGVATPDPNSPIYSQPSDPFIVPYFQMAGTYPYYCTTEYAQGMMGVIFVVP